MKKGFTHLNDCPINNWIPKWSIIMGFWYISFIPFGGLIGVLGIKFRNQHLNDNSPQTMTRWHPRRVISAIAYIIIFILFGLIWIIMGIIFYFL